MHHVYSTLSNPQNYCAYSELQANNPVVEKIRSVLIKGGSGIAQKNLQTPLGVATPVTDDQLAFLQAHKTFKDHVKNGFITIRKSVVAPEKAAAGMATRDKSAPVVPNDFKESDVAQPVDNKKKEKLAKGK